MATCLIVHDDVPPDWNPGGRVALLLHGLVGCHLSGYMVRISTKLQARACARFDLTCEAAVPARIGEKTIFRRLLG